MKKHSGILIMLFLIIFSSLTHGQTIIKKTNNYALIDSPGNLGDIGDKVLITRLVNKKKIEIATGSIINFKNDRTVAKVEKLFTNEDIRVGDLVENYKGNGHEISSLLEDQSEVNEKNNELNSESR